MAADYEKRMLRVQTYIHDNPSGDMSLDTLADVAALSRFHFQRTYRLLSGETATQTVKRIRMHRASVALIHSSASLTQIAKDVGYPNATSFTRAFSETFGMPPNTFRKLGAFRTPTKPNRPTAKETFMHSIIIRNEPKRDIVGLPHKGNYQLIGREFEHLFTALGTRGLMGKTGTMVGVYLHDPESTPEPDLRSFAGTEFPATDVLDSPIERMTLPSGRHAVLRVKGPYTALPAAYTQLYREWLPMADEVPANSPVYELYLNNPRETAPEDLLTEICLPLS
ncbi:MAG: AraC family transcriptional regulator [Pseudorhodobacter sp.]